MCFVVPPTAIPAQLPFRARHLESCNLNIDMVFAFYNLNISHLSCGTELTQDLNDLSKEFEEGINRLGESID
jgi:hypothetical protein